MGCVFIRHGGKHDWYQNPRTKVSQAVPRHREIKEQLARHIEILNGFTRLRRVKPFTSSILHLANYSK